ncbi:GATA-type sexual development transcription factor NsdD [Aspergillus clavatus NRRL 1]|uniref:Sexual development transcription factor NsdD n=1 Tax=Aspergillus clavatus (strain ATCC 1007 / CBS 513.65 / DSM 816 / NCTC 3887 / NRRL 1 / QM 1276 / 107) TaxID=344612 RepID=A1CLA8_ASPCL|nr:sexual development transcription factor NsdD [Aspergillus clavatus NRRL 1]EAW09932.1 sexual development transcription factor NsdD [Aspergillus clavatus NRRL 1]
MGSLETTHRQREHLPAINFLGKDGPGYSSRSSAVSSPTPLVSPTTMYPNQSSPYSYQPSAASALAQPGYISSPDSRRALEEEKEKQLQPQRQSLPSIHEALRNDNSLPYPAPPTSAPPPQTHHAPPPHALVSRPAGDGPSGPPNPFLNGTPTGQYLRDPPFPHQSQLQADASRSSLASINTQDSRNPSLQSLNSGKSPTHSAKTGLTSITGSQAGSGYEYSAPASAGSVASPNGYASYSQPYAFHSQPPSSAPAYPSAGHHDTRPYSGTSWKPGPPEPVRVEELKNGLAGRPAVPVPPQSDSAKRHLEIYEVESSLNEIAELSTRTLDFSRHYAARAHQTQRSGPMLGSLPSLHEIEDMINLQRRNQDALMRIRTAVLNQEHAMAEQMAQRKAFGAGGVHDGDHMAMYQEEYKGNGGFAGPDTKKRRGKAAPPGRCHSCNRAETPEWRRGPDGARTLCNACGLHYAKLTRKMGASKAAALGSSLKPKAALDSASPNAR